MGRGRLRRGRGAAGGGGGAAVRRRPSDQALSLSPVRVSASPSSPPPPPLPSPASFPPPAGPPVMAPTAAASALPPPQCPAGWEKMPKWPPATTLDSPIAVLLLSTGNRRDPAPLRPGPQPALASRSGTSSPPCGAARPAPHLDAAPGPVPFRAPSPRRDPSAADPSAGACALSRPARPSPRVRAGGRAERRGRREPAAASCPGALKWPLSAGTGVFRLRPGPFDSFGHAEGRARSPALYPKALSAWEGAVLVNLG